MEEFEDIKPTKSQTLRITIALQKQTKERICAKKTHNHFED